MRFVAAAILVSALAWALPVAAQKKVQCWTDKSGQRMCGDRVPPEYAGQKREVMKDGRVVETVKAASTPEEIAEEKRKQREAEEAQRRRDYDRALLETYRSAKDIESMRDERLALLDSRITSTEKNLADTTKDLERLRGQAEAATKEGKPVQERVAKQIREREKAQKQQTGALERARKERADIETKFNSDLARYTELRGGKPAEKPAAAAASPATPAAPGTKPATPAAPAPKT
jgi:chromosome segregation ATPase